MPRGSTQVGGDDGGDGGGGGDGDGDMILPFLATRVLTKHGGSRPSVTTKVSLLSPSSRWMLVWLDKERLYTADAAI